MSTINNCKRRGLLKHSFSIILVMSLFISCNKLVEVDVPYTNISGDNVFLSESTAISALTSIYAQMSSNRIPSGILTSISLFGGLSSDELSLYPASTNTTLISYYKNALTNSSTGSSDFWLNTYPIIYNANSAIEGLSNSTIDINVKKQLLGEARFMRAFCYFYLVNLYGDLPLVLGTDYKINSSLGRQSVNDIWIQIVTDLKYAKENLSGDYLNSSLKGVTDERIRPTKWAASALLARSYLYTSNYQEASNESNVVINNVDLYNLPSLDNVFLKNSSEAIWQLQPVTTGWNTPDARLFNLPATGPSETFPVYLSQQQIQSFENGDNRRIMWVNERTVGTKTYSYSNKYKSSKLNNPVTEYSTVIRLAELYLIRAESRAHLGIIEGTNSAISDINMIRNRSGLENYAGQTDLKSILSAILHERQVELFTEWGHRWLDIKRTSEVNTIMPDVTGAKGGTWDSRWVLYPIPLNQLLISPNVKQNQGYD
jgi:hypothetical protein